MSIAGTATRYVRPGMVALLVACAIVAAALGCVTLWRSLRLGQSLRPAADRPEAVSVGIGWLLLVALVAVLVVAPPGLGLFHAERYGSVLDAHVPARFPAVPDGDPVRMSLVEYAGRAVAERGSSLSGRRVVLSGFIVAGEGSRPYLARLIVGCCAADARPVFVGLAGDVPADLVPGEWIEVVGAYTDHQVDHDPLTEALIPYLAVSAVRSIAMPADPYES